MKKPHIYICIEIKKREYDSQILFAAKAAIEGFRVYLGTHAAIYALLKKKGKGGVLLDKGPIPAQRIEWLKKRVDSICILDAELSPIMNLNYAKTVLPTRIYPETEVDFERYFVVGSNIQVAAQEYSELLRSRITLTGWPRVDFWTKYGLQTYDVLVFFYKKKYGNFLLYAANFGNIRNPELTKYLKSPDPVQDSKLNELDTQIEQYNNFKRAISTIRKWDSNPEFPTLIVRPHTSEPKSVWQKELRKLKKTIVVDEGDITPWILASIGVIHNGSTTSIQAFLSNKPSIIIKSLTPPVTQEICSAMSEFSIAEESSTAEFDVSYPARNGDFNPSLLSELIANSSGGACEAILSELKHLTIRSEARICTAGLIMSQINFRSMRRFVGLIRDEIQWIFGRTNMNSQLHFVPGGLDRKKIDLMFSKVGEFRNVRHRRKTVNLWEFETQ